MEWPAWLPDDPALRLASLMAGLLVIVTVLVLLQVLAVSAFATRRQRQREAFNRLWRPRLALASLGDGGGEAPAPPRGEPRLWWLMLWNRMQRQLRGESSARLNRYLAALGMERHAIALLHGRGVRRRLVALETLRHLADPKHWDAADALVRGRNPFVAFAAAQAMIAMDAERATRALLPVALAREDWGGQRLTALCRQAGREAVTVALLESLERGGSAGEQARMAPLIAFATPARVAPWAREHLRHDADAGNRRAALKALGELSDPRDKPLLLRALQDEDAGVRLAAAQALRGAADAGDMAPLLAALADRSWWVRRQVADMLVALPRMDEATLESLPLRVEDRYGREALERALAERRSRGASP